jgi:hypothetical protein
MTTRRRWTDESITTELRPIVAELGRMPTRRELTDRGVGGAWSAMQRRGGVAAWAERLTPAPGSAPPAVAEASPLAAPTRLDIERRAYFIAHERGGDPVGNWLAAEAELLAV